ncbi:uncharacterized protein LOC144172958 [Haemaphysalis longicornis]
MLGGGTDARDRGDSEGRRLDSMDRCTASAHRGNQVMLCRTALPERENARLHNAIAEERDSFRLLVDVLRVRPATWGGAGGFGGAPQEPSAGASPAELSSSPTAVRLPSGSAGSQSATSPTGKSASTPAVEPPTDGFLDEVYQAVYERNSYT